LKKVSGNTAYKELANKHVNFFKQADGKFGSEPKVIAQTIIKAIEAKKPKTRYAVGGGAKPILFMRKILSDRMFDSIMLSQINGQKV